MKKNTFNNASYYEDDDMVSRPSYTQKNKKDKNKKRNDVSDFPGYDRQKEKIENRRANKYKDKTKYNNKYDDKWN